MAKGRSRSTQLPSGLLKVLRANKKFLMVAHESPDGDSLGSAMAMGAALRKLKKDVRFMTDMVPQKYNYLPLVGEANSNPPADIGQRVAMLFDTPTLDRLGTLKPFICQSGLVINVDHHVSNHYYGAINWVDPKAASVGEQVYRLCEQLGVRVDKGIATCLYTSLVTDTGKFQYANTTAFSHQLAAKLIATGIAHQEITERIYEDYPKEKLALVAGALETLKLEYQGKVAWLVASQDLFRRTGSSMEWADDLINYARGIRGVQVAVVFKEEEQPGKYRLSFRSRRPRIADVNKLAKVFGGGGHPAAAGCNMQGSLGEISRQIMVELGKIYGRC